MNVLEKIVWSVSTIALEFTLQTNFLLNLFLFN